MIFHPTTLDQAFVIEYEPIKDERGFFARSFCQNEFAQRALEKNVAQCNVSFNLKRGTLRGMHFQLSPHSEAKLVRCISGSIYDVIIDLRKDSVSYLQWFGCELSSKNRKSLYIPEGFAHGFQTLQDDSEVFYQMFDFYSPMCAVGIRWDDPQFNISWPLPVNNISEKDQTYPDFCESML
ncbi:dTDP-4-dehydrorhamnose 3,5-epimerase [Paraglaciecola arctica]|uniref:dTDP-4-dehydrorhamnose 3,5-epimerase n=1 Tax=Paraglaciecola arctica TaxID=1128911 RepID=UPI001C06E364|nr:dTDP-4-dehydrorhamnose 3,5-epimerase [Paraglaciecola arctica]MBU3002087.1 dTDP-4-dehydrorhamnose 3,5-epimerase [Paraglaciecola arctica]